MHKIHTAFKIGQNWKYIYNLWFAWQDNHCSVICYGICAITLITPRYIFPIRLFGMLLNDYLLLKKGENNNNKTNPLLFSFFFCSSILLSVLVNLTLTEKACTSFWPLCPIYLKSMGRGSLLRCFPSSREKEKVKRFNHYI